ncbi:MAG: helix-turn-helix transcriptional regulator [Alphaproteobacteria bacterium]|nr:helix-turn-helix transcriptional regulator [Alphaproteobacteria bacterium]
MISPEQIRGARGLLGWTQLELAKQSGLSKTVVNNIERMLVKPHSRTLETITRTLEEQGVEFFGQYGVDLKKDLFKVSVYEGPDSFPRYLRDVVDTVRGTGLEPLHFNVDDALVIRQGYQSDYHRYFEDLRRYDIREKVMVREGDTTRYAPHDTSSYRWIPKALFSQNGYSVYGNTYSIFMFGIVNRVINIRNSLVADIFRKQFNATWAQARPQPKTPSLFEKYAETSL